MKRITTLALIFVAVAAMGLGCANRKTTKVVSPGEDYSLYDMENNNSGATTTTATTTTTGTTVPGYRVQIFASNTNDGAEKIASDARFKFTERVYVEYDPPYYKVRIGDYQNRSDAEILREKAKNLGFADAWIVQTEVNAQ